MRIRFPLRRSANPPHRSQAGPPRFPRLRGFLRATVDLFPWRPLGLFVGATAGFGLSEYAYRQLDLVFLVLGYGALGLLGLSTLAVVVGTLVLVARLRRHPMSERESRVETDRPLPSGFSVPTYWWLPLVQIDWSIEYPEGIEAQGHRGDGKVREHLLAHQRGRFRQLRRRFVVQDPFGLTRIAFRHTDPLRLEIMPHVGRLRRIPSLRALSGGEDIPHPMGTPDGDRVELRRYAPGDPARFIHWKLFARTRKLIVRMPERALIQTERVVAYLAAGLGDDASAAAARVALEAGLGEDWAFGTDGLDGTEDTTTALSAIVDSAAYRTDGGTHLGSFLAEQDRRGPASLVLFLPPTLGPWTERILAQARRRPGRCQAIIGVDGLDQGVGAQDPGWTRRGWRRLLWIPPKSAQTSLTSLREVVTELERAQIHVTLFDRTSGRTLAAAHLQASGVAPKATAPATQEAA